MGSQAKAHLRGERNIPYDSVKISFNRHVLKSRLMTIRNKSTHTISTGTIKELPKYLLKQGDPRNRQLMRKLEAKGKYFGDARAS